MAIMKYMAALAALLCVGFGLRTHVFIAATSSGGGGGGSGDSCSSCTNETFEGTGYAVAGWSEAGSVINEDYTTSPAPLVGSQSLLVKNVAFDTSYSEINLPNTTEGWMRFIINMTNTVVNGWHVASICDSGGAEIAAVRITSGQFQLVSGTATATVTDAPSANTLYYCWLHYKLVSGANNDEADFGYSTTKTRPTSGSKYASLNTGSPNVNAQIYRLGGGDLDFGGAVAGTIYDSFSATTLGVIGDFP